MFHIGLRMAVDMQHQDAITYVYDLMANLSYDMGDFKKAERLFVSVMQRLISLKGLEQTDNAIVEMCLKLASIHSRTNEHEKAEMGYKFCIESQQGKTDENSAGFVGDEQRFVRPIPDGPGQSQGRTNRI